MEKHELNKEEREVQEFYKHEKADVIGGDIGVKARILAKLRNDKSRVKDDVVYGVYNNANMSLWVRINDFIIDHSSVTLKDKSYFFHMLAVMVDAGIGIVQSLKSLAARTDNQRFTRILNTIAANVEGGATLSDSMRRFENVFDESETQIVASGEATGRLDDMLFKLSGRLDDRYELNMKLWGAAVYPLVVLGVLVVVAAIMLIWVFPTLLNLFGESGVGLGELPLATRMLIVVQNVIVNFWWVILLLLFGAYGLFMAYVGTEWGRVNWDYFKLRIPLLGAMLQKVYVLRFVDMLGLLIGSGVPVLKSLEMIGNSMGNETYKLVVSEIIDGVRVGEKISARMGQFALLFPSEVVQMIRTGESSASVAVVSDKIAVQYKKEIDNGLKRLTSVFEPFLIVTVGLFVALLALAIMGPIFNLGGTV